MLFSIVSNQNLATNAADTYAGEKNRIKPYYHEEKVALRECDNLNRYHPSGNYFVKPSVFSTAK